MINNAEPDAAESSTCDDERLMDSVRSIAGWLNGRMLCP